MEKTIYLILAATGCAILVLQLLMQVFGLTGSGDMDGGHGMGGLDHAGHGDAGAGAHDGGWFFGILSLKALVAFAGLFGLTGLFLLREGWATVPRVSVSVLAGVVGMFIVAFLMRSLGRLSSSGTLDIQNAVGGTAGVYLRIPGQGKGLGKVTVEVQGRSVQIDAVTPGDPIATGQRVRVTGLADSRTLEVRPL